MTAKKTYISTLNKQKQEQLNLLIEEFEAYPVGTGYIDIIIIRDRLINFINKLTNIGIVINSVSWWCNATDENKNKYGCPHGLGGPLTKFGLFTEIGHDFDDMNKIERELFVSLDNDFNEEIIKKINVKIINLIQNKQIFIQENIIFLTFQDNHCLTPGLWLYVPDDWVSKIEK